MTRFWRNSVGNCFLFVCFLLNFLWKYRMCFFKVKYCFGHISAMVGLIDLKRKGGASVWFWVNCVTSTFDLTHDIELWFFKVNFQNSCISEIAIWLMWNKKKANKLLGCRLYGLALWPHPWPWPCSFKLRSKLYSLIWVMVGLIDMERKGCESIIHDHYRDLCMCNHGGVGRCTR